MKHFLAISDYSSDEIKELLKLSASLKKKYKAGRKDLTLANKTLAMLFEKQSLRTRISFQVAMTQLGGSAIYIKPEDIGGIGKREPVKDMARVLSRYVDGIMARTFEHGTIIDLAKYSDVPVINALSDFSHPCQAMADIMTIQEYFDSLNGLKLVFIGDGNNVARSLAYVCAKVGMRITVASPKGYELDDESVVRVNEMFANTVTQVNDPVEAVSEADVIYTDTWVSMGQEEQKQQRIRDFEGFQINGELLSKAPPHAKIMHCLPAYRDNEITDEAAECENSIIFDQAENRLHFQKGLLKKLMG